MKLQLAKRGIYFIPATDQDRQKANKISQGEVVDVNYLKNRNTAFHRKFFALLKIGFDNQPEYNGEPYKEQPETFELYRAKVLIGIGFCDFIFTDTGNINYIPKSISYDSLPDNNDFERLVYTPAVEYIAAKLNIINQELAYEVESQFI